jgi:hypothetical protein
MPLMIIVGAIVALILVLFLIGAVVKLVTAIAMLFLVALLAGVIANAVVKYNNGLTFTFVSGLAGGVLGLVLKAILGGPALLTLGGLPVIWTIAGAIIVVFVAKVVDRGPRRSRA